MTQGESQGLHFFLGTHFLGRQHTGGKTKLLLICTFGGEQQGSTGAGQGRGQGAGQGRGQLIAGGDGCTGAGQLIAGGDGCTGAGAGAGADSLETHRT